MNDPALRGERIILKMPGNNTKNHIAENGFTLVEMLVSMAIFTLSMGVVMSLFTFSLRSQRVLLAHSQLINEMSYNMEHISRGLRMAQKSDGASCLTQDLNYLKTAAGIKFIQPTNTLGVNDCVEYYLGHPGGYPAGARALMEKRSGPGGSFDLPLTSPDVNVLDFEIIDSGWSQYDNEQPRVTLLIKARGQGNEILEVQMTTSQRNLDAE